MVEAYPKARDHHHVTMSLRLALKKSLTECVHDAVPSSCVDGSDDEIPRRRRQPRRAAAAAAAAANVEHISSVGERHPSSRKRKSRSPESCNDGAPVNKCKKSICKVDGCALKRIQGGVCRRHGAKTRKYLCKELGCDKTALPRTGGKCSRHSLIKPKRKRCQHPGCTSIAKCKGGLCNRHAIAKGAKVKRWVCKEPGCDKSAVTGGKCYMHSLIKPKRKKCQHPGCTKYAKSDGLCYHHGDDGKGWVCKEPGCDKYAQSSTGGKCYKHSQIKPKRKRCQHPGCTKDAWKRGGLCCTHAEREDCTFPGCSNIVILFGVCGRHGAYARSMCALPKCRKMAVKGELCPDCGGPPVPEGEVDQSKTRVRRRMCNHPDGCTNLAKKNGLCEHHIEDRPMCQVDGCTNWEVKWGVCRRHVLEGTKRPAMPDKVKSVSRRTTKTRSSNFDDSDSEDIDSNSDEEVELKAAQRRSDRKRNPTSLKEPETESEDEDDGSTDKPTREILAWVRSMSEEDQRKYVTTGLRVKMRFSNNIWYGGIIKNVVKRGRRGTTVAIDFDDDTEEVMDFPHHDIIVDDMNNGEHKADAMAFVPHKTSEDDYDQSEVDNEGEGGDVICQPRQPVHATSNAVSSGEESDSEDDEELGALIYRSSETGKSILSQFARKDDNSGSLVESAEM